MCISQNIATVLKCETSGMLFLCEDENGVDFHICVRVPLN